MPAKGWLVGSADQQTFGYPEGTEEKAGGCP